jgi:hypothetical protein
MMQFPFGVVLLADTGWALTVMHGVAVHDVPPGRVLQGRQVSYKSGGN